MQTPNVTPSASQVRLDLRNALTNQSISFRADFDRRADGDRGLERAAEGVEGNAMPRRGLADGQRATAAGIDAEGVEDRERGRIPADDVVHGGTRVDGARDSGGVWCHGVEGLR